MQYLLPLLLILAAGGYWLARLPQNYIYFRQNNFEEIAGRIKNVFGITVINESNNKAWRFTGAFKNSTAKDIIENICLVKKLSFVANGDTIFIK